MLKLTKKNHLREFEEILEFNQQNVVNGKSIRGYGWTHIAKRDITAGEIVVKAFGRILDHQTGHCSIQIQPQTHLLPTKWTGKYWNHSCNPNCGVQTDETGLPQLFALRNIKVGEEINFAYYMTEYQWASHCDEAKITCMCGADNCDGHIHSFSELSVKEQIAAYKSGIISEYLEEIVKQKLIKLAI